MNQTELNRLRDTCHTFLQGYKTLSPAAQFAAMAEWCETHQISYDTYGEGEVVQQFEEKIAHLLGMPAALFCITGTLTQVTCLRLACQERQSNLVGLHPSSHIYLHENSNYQLMQHFTPVRIGHPLRLWDVADLRQIPDRLAAVQYELPMREIGGQLPSWQQLQDVKAYCKENNIHLHMDGARLWEAQAGLAHSYSEIVDGFDTVYVSLYKGLGGLGGAMLVGQSEFIAKAKVWMHRQGGSVFRRTPYVVAAAMQFDQRIAMMPALLERTRQLYKLLSGYPVLMLNPSNPETSIFHVYLPVSRDRALQIRNKIANEHGIWLFNNVVHAPLHGQSMFEWNVGDHLLDLSDQSLCNALDLLISELT